MPAKATFYFVVTLDDYYAATSAVDAAAAISRVTLSRRRVAIRYCAADCRHAALLPMPLRRVAESGGYAMLPRH